ncbi:DUF4397 domain-containing protein [Pseudidiomarina sp. 1ASP75-14]|uniref:DUF4397 domain-containing protein n=1 Tax=Pseudidiomarina terrestris TaxID=2820060 RepID=UPI002652E381|nr:MULTISPECIES: DUF4397 domain-containing protein [unclassified Pseudidiomarina]MDN7126178.1 DUF4397 domain-containing protein [Pseudidiomarina sp. 1APR75-33.1]MDN7137109.1 DUF4397 domain-containing protein [Pseudidiomarina sp. 1ASP75-14]
MNGITKYSIPVLAVLMLAACDSDNDDAAPVVEPPPPPPASTYVRVHHSVADAPDVNVLLDGEIALEAVPFGASSGVIELEEATYSIQVDGILADETTATVIGPADVELNADMRYEVFAVGKVGDESIAPLIFANDYTAVSSGNTRVEVVHAAPDAPPVDVYVTTPGADLSAESAVTTLAFSDNSGQVEVPAGDYQVRITVAGEPASVVYDSGTLTLADGADLVVAAVANTMTGDSPVMLQVADGEGAVLVPDVDAGADIRVVHASADAPAVDVTVNNAAEPAIPGLQFLSATDFINLPAGDYLFDVAAAGGDPLVLDDVPLTLATSDQLSVYAVGALSDSSLTLAVISDMQRRIATEAQIQLVHASPSAGNVDIYVTTTEDLTDATPAFADVPFAATALVSTGYVSLPPGDYVVTVTAAGTTTPAIGPVNLTLEGGGIYTAAAVDATGGGLPPQLLLLDDLAPAM